MVQTKIYSFSKGKVTPCHRSCVKKRNILNIRYIDLIKKLLKHSGYNNDVFLQFNSNIARINKNLSKFTIRNNLKV